MNHVVAVDLGGSAAQLGPDAGLIGTSPLGWQHINGQHLSGQQRRAESDHD